MFAKSFRGGIHPPERKTSQIEAGVFPLPPPQEVAIPVTQHLGPPNKPAVSVGDPVRRGQVIADGDAPFCVPVHSSINGVVRRIEPRTLASGAEAMCVVIEASSDQYGECRLPVFNPFECSREDALFRVRQAGIVGMGGASFPTHVKLNPPAGKAIDFFIANGAECEPYLVTDELLMAKRSAKLVNGMAIAMWISGAKKGVIAVETNKDEILPALRGAVKAADREDEISVVRVRTKYPQGGEKMLIAAITGREVPSGGLPADCGCIVQNVETLVAVSDAFANGQPVVDRPLTVSGGAVRNPVNVMAPIGVSASWLAEQVCGEPLPRGTVKIVSGGPLMGQASSVPDFPVQKNTSGILFLTAEEAPSEEEGQCIRCGRCLRACACRLSPALLHAAIAAKDWALADGIGLLDCIECGTCAYVCPARVKLVQRFKTAKPLLRAWKKKETARG